MTALSVYVGINVEYYGPRGRSGFTLPLLPLTWLINLYYQLRRRVWPAARPATRAARLQSGRRQVRQPSRLVTVLNVLSIGFRSLAWATVGV